MKKFLAVALLALAAVSIYQWNEKRLLQLEAQLFTQQVRAATRNVVAQIDLFRDSRGVTYAEAITAANDRVAEIDKLLKENAEALTVKDKVAADSVAAYLKASQEAVRWSRAIILAKVESAAAKNTMREALADMEAYLANPRDGDYKFRSDVARYSANPAIRRNEKAFADAQYAADSLGKVLSEMVLLRPKRPKLIPDDAYLQDANVKDLTLRLD